MLEIARRKPDNATVDKKPSELMEADPHASAFSALVRAVGCRSPRRASDLAPLRVAYGRLREAIGRDGDSPVIDWCERTYRHSQIAFLKTLCL